MSVIIVMRTSWQLLISGERHVDSARQCESEERLVVRAPTRLPST